MKQNTVNLKDELLNERQNTHGDYNEVARISQSIRNVLKSGVNWKSMNDCQREALEMICSKLGRVMSGNYNFKDHWDDISGYAKLGSLFSLEEKKEVNPSPTVTIVGTGGYGSTIRVNKLNFGDLDDTFVGP